MLDVLLNDAQRCPAATGSEVTWRPQDILAIAFFELHRLRVCLHHFRRMEANQRTLLRIEEIFPLQLSVLYVASGMHTRRLDPDIQNRRRSFGRPELYARTPLLKSPGDLNRSLHVELDRTLGSIDSNTGTCARPALANTANTKTHSATVLMPLSLRSSLA